MTVFCNRIVPQPGVFTNSNTYVKSFYNRQTNINQTFINQNNAGVSINNNITVNNYGIFGRRQSLGTVNPGFGCKIGQFLGGYRNPIQKIGCGCQARPQIGWGQQFRQAFHYPVQRFCSSIAGTLRGFMGARLSNV